MAAGPRRATRARAMLGGLCEERRQSPPTERTGCALSQPNYGARLASVSHGWGPLGPLGAAPLLPPKLRSLPRCAAGASIAPALSYSSLGQTRNLMLSA